MSSAVRAALPIVAAALAGSMGVSVVWVRAETAATDGMKIYMPALPLEGPSLRKYVLGYVSHEAAHIRFTQFEVLEPLRNSGTLKNLVGVFEDTRVERKLCGVYPGTRRFLQELVDALIADGAYQKFDPSNQSGLKAVLGWCFAYVHQAVMQYKGWKEEEKRYRLQVQGLVSAAVFADVEAALKDVVSATSTRDCVNVAERVLRNFPQPPDQEDECGSPAGQLCSSRGEIVKAMLPEQIADAILEASSNGHGTSTLAFPTVYKTAKSDFRSGVLGAVRRSTIALREAVEELLRGPTERGLEIRSSGRELSRRAAVRLAQKSPKVFLRRTRDDEVDAAIVILVDKSSSMTMSLGLASRVALALAEVFEVVENVKVSVVAFPHGDEGVLELKSFDDGVRIKAPFFADLVARGSTPLSSALLYANSLLMNVGSSRQLVLTLTDGQPDSIQECRDLLSCGISDGIEYLGIGIQTDISHLMRDSVTVASIQELPMSALKLLRKAFQPNAR